MRNWQFFLSTILFFSIESFADISGSSQPVANAAVQAIAEASKTTIDIKTKDGKPVRTCEEPHGWSFDLGGQYTYMWFSTPPTYRGSTGGAVGKITYQKADAFFGQLRSVYNSGNFSSSNRKSIDNEWYTEMVGGYCFRADTCWTVTPYAGVGLDFVNDHKRAFGTLSGIKLHYRTSYAIFGFDTKYSWDTWYLGLQAECLPIYHQYLRIEGLSGEAWTMSSRVGAAVRIPIGYIFSKHVGIELTPYYRYMPVGSSNVLALPERNLNQAGAFLSFRFFI